MDGVGGVAAVADGPDHQRGAPDDVAGGEDARQAGLHGLEVGLHRAPAGDREVGRGQQVRQVFRIEAQGLDDQAGGQVEVAALDLLGRLAAGGVGRAEPHADGAQAVGVAGVAEHGAGGGQPFEHHAFLLGVGDLAGRAGHVGAIAAVEAGHRLRALAHGGAHAVHGGVAAADHDDVAARGVELAAVIGRDAVAEADAVRGDQVVERRRDPGRAGARGDQLAGRIDADSDQDRVVAGAQLVQAGVAADLEAEFELDAAIGQAGGAPLDHVLFQLEAGDAVDQQAAGAVVTVVDGDVITGFAQPLGGGQARGAGADDPDRLAAGGTGAQGLDPAFLPGLVGQVAFDRADGDGAVAGLLDGAGALAQAVLRADAAADLRHRVGGLRQGVGFLEPALGGHPQPVGDVVVQRTVGLTERDAALRAARSLLAGLRVDEVGVDLVEIARTGLCGALGGRRAFYRRELQHALGHGRKTSIPGC